MTKGNLIKEYSIKEMDWLASNTEYQEITDTMNDGTRLMFGVIIIAGKYYGINWEEMNESPNNYPELKVYQGDEVVQIDVTYTRLGKTSTYKEWIYIVDEEYINYMCQQKEPKPKPIKKLQLGGNYIVGEDIRNTANNKSPISFRQVKRLLDINYILTGNVTTWVNNNNIVNMSVKHAGTLIKEGKDLIKSQLLKGDKEICERMLHIAYKD